MSYYRKAEINNFTGSYASSEGRRNRRSPKGRAAEKYTSFKSDTAPNQDYFVQTDLPHPQEKFYNSDRHALKESYADSLGSGSSGGSPSPLG